MAGKDLTYNVAVDAGDAVSGLRKLETAVRSTMRTVEGELDEGATAGDKLAASIDKVAASMKEDFNSAAIAAEELQRALKDAGSGMDVGDALTSLQRMGLSFDEITQDADKLAASLKQLDDVKATGVKDLDAVAPGLATKLDGVAKSADSSKSVLANMVGNATQDLGALTGIAGSAGVAIGQMGEYMVDAKADGDSLGQVFKNFAAVAGPIAAIGLVVGTLTTLMGNQAAAAEASAARTKSFGDAMDGAADKGEALVDTLKNNSDMLTEFDAHAEGFGANIVEGLSEIGKAIPGLGGIIGDAGQNISDLIPIMKAADFSARDFADAIANGGRVGDEWWKKLREGVAAGKISEEQYLALSGAIEKYGIEALKGQEITDFFAESTKLASTHVADLNRAYADAASSSTAYEDAQQHAADAVQRVNDKLREQADALNEQVDAATSAADSQLAANDAFAKFGDVLGDSEASANDVRDAAIDLAKATVRLADDQAKATGTTQTATQKLDAQNAALLSTAAAASGPARSGILDYIASVNQIPPEKMTEIQAAIDAGDLATARRLLDEASGTRTAAISADAQNLAATDNALDNVAMPFGKARIAGITVQVLNPNYGADIGRIIRPGPSMVPIAPDEVVPAALGATPTALGAGPALTATGAASVPQTVGGVPVIPIPVAAYLAAYPTAAEILAAIGRPRIPIDLVVGSSVRITGVRE